MQGLLNSLMATPAAKPAKAAKAPKTSEPKEATWWVKATQHVRTALKPTIDSHNSALPEGGKKVTGTAALTVASALKKAGLLAEGMMPTDAQIQKSFADYMANPPEPKPKADSVASASSGGSKPKKAKAELTEEEATAARAAKSAKAKATREKNKAMKAATAAVVEPFVDMPFILNGHSYLRIENSLWDAGTDAWVGELDPATNSINASATEPTRQYE